NLCLIIFIQKYMGTLKLLVIYPSFMEILQAIGNSKHDAPLSSPVSLKNHWVAEFCLEVSIGIKGHNKTEEAISLNNTIEANKVRTARQLLHNRYLLCKGRVCLLAIRR